MLNTCRISCLSKGSTWNQKGCIGWQIGDKFHDPFFCCVQNATREFAIEERRFPTVLQTCHLTGQNCCYRDWWLDDPPRLDFGSRTTPPQTRLVWSLIQISPKLLSATNLVKRELRLYDSQYVWCLTTWTELHWFKRAQFENYTTLTDTFIMSHWYLESGFSAIATYKTYVHFLKTL